MSIRMLPYIETLSREWWSSLTNDELWAMHDEVQMERSLRRLHMSSQRLAESSKSWEDSQARQTEVMKEELGK